MPLRKAMLAEAGDLSRMLARAFDEDPVFCFLFPQEQDRRRRLPRLFEGLCRHVHLRHPEAWVMAGEQGIGGAAFWNEPDRWKVSLLTILRMAPSTLPVLGARTPLTLRVLAVMERMHPRTPRHRYLAAIGVDPSRQGQGVGAALLAPMLERCDREGTPAYLESSNEKNHSFYRRHGFEITDGFDVPGGGPRVVGMWRAPRAAPRERRSTPASAGT